MLRFAVIVSDVAMCRAGILELSGAENCSMFQFDAYPSRELGPPLA
jgi:hypothetical protein